MMDFESARRNMVEMQLRTSGITDRRLLQVVAQVPREQFIPESRKALAYTDDNHPLSAGLYAREIASVAPLAKLLQLAAVGTVDRVLHVGCNTGYLTAVLAGLAEHVTAIDDEPALVGETTDNLAALGIGNVTVLNAPLATGAKTNAPYDLIFIEGSVDAVPQSLLEQLKEGGRLVALVRAGATAVAHLYVRSGSDFASRAEFNASLPPLRMTERVEEFVF
jgi:protein-L-isoaspartate(D-aspartate) O-methyltransferase